MLRPALHPSIEFLTCAPHAHRPSVDRMNNRLGGGI